MKKGITLKDLANKLNMSVSTVSKALNDDASISNPTRERVKALAEEWEYVPNEAARHFKQNKTFTLGLVIPDLLDQFYVLAINGVEKIAAQKNYNVIVSQSHEDVAYENKILDLMSRNRVDGIIIAMTKNTSNMTAFTKLANMGIPVVFFSRSPQNSSFSYVSADNEDGVVKAMRFLFKKGHVRIAHLMGPASMQVSQIRLNSYQKALLNENIPVDLSLIKEIDFTQPGTFKAMRQLMKLKCRPTAIFTFKNYISLDVILFLKKQHPDILDIIDIVGFGNLPLLQYLDQKPSASVEENAYAMGIEAALLVFQSIELQETGQNQISRHIKVPCELIIHT